MVFGSKRKGSRAENELMKILMCAGYCAIRAAGSGTGSPCPDILAFKNVYQFGFECKAVQNQNLQLRKEQIDNLIAWQDKTNITTYIAWRQTGGEWIFIRTDYLKKNENSYSLNLNDAKKFGISSHELIK